MSHASDPIFCAINELRGDRGSEAIAEACTKWSGQTVVVTTTVDWTTYRPHTKGRVVLSATAVGESSVEQFKVLVVIDPPGEERATRVPVGHPDDLLPPFFIEPWNARAWVLPHVPRPSALPVVLDSQSVATILGAEQVADSPTLVRYVPMRRALVRAEADGAIRYLKTFAKRQRYESAVSGLEAAARLPLSTPRLVATDPELKTLVMDELQGVELSSLVSSPASLALALRCTGHALGRLHSTSPCASDARPSTAEMAEIEDLLVGDLAAVEPRLGGRIEELARQLADDYRALKDHDPVMLHGKLFGDQILVDADLNDVSIVDWDDATVGDAHFDLARLIAHLRFVARERGSDLDFTPLLSAYGEEGREIDPHRLRWHLAAATLLRGKISLLRPLAPRWLERFDALADDVSSILDGSVVRDVMGGGR